jgi:hypothetical protein
MKDKMIALKNKTQQIPSKMKETYAEHEDQIKNLTGQIATQVVLVTVGVLVSRTVSSLVDSFLEGFDSADQIEVD